MIPRAIICTPRYFALVVPLCILPPSNGSHLKCLLLAGLGNICGFAASNDHSKLFSFSHLEQICTAKTSSHTESASNMMSSAYRQKQEFSRFYRLKRIAEQLVYQCIC